MKIFLFALSANVVLNAVFALLFWLHGDATPQTLRHLLWVACYLAIFHLIDMVKAYTTAYPRKRPCERCKTKTTHMHTSILDPDDRVYLCQACCDTLEREARQSLQSILQEFGPPTKRSYEASPKIH